MKARRVTLVVLVLVAIAVAIFAGIGTGDSFADDGDLWGGPDSASVEAEP